VNLITDVAVCSNDTDGAYGSEDNDKKMEELDITHVQTAVRGRKAEVSIQIEEVSDGQYTVKCPRQSVSSQKTRTRYKALICLVHLRINRMNQIFNKRLHRFICGNQLQSALICVSDNLCLFYKLLPSCRLL